MTRFEFSRRDSFRVHSGTTGRAAILTECPAHVTYVYCTYLYTYALYVKLIHHVRSVDALMHAMMRCILSAVSPCGELNGLKNNELQGRARAGIFKVLQRAAPMT